MISVSMQGLLPLTLRVFMLTSFLFGSFTRVFLLLVDTERVFEHYHHAPS